MLEKAKPVYKVLPGWKEDIRGIKNEDLPETAVNTLNFIEGRLDIRLLWSAADQDERILLSEINKECKKIVRSLSSTFLRECRLIFL